MMPLTMAGENTPVRIKRIGGNTETKQFLENLGFNIGSPVTVISASNGNMIVQVKESRIAISKEMAMKIMV